MKLSIACLTLLAAVIAAGLLGSGLAFACSQPTQSYYGGGGYLSGQVLGFDYLNYLTPVAWARVTATNGLYSLSTSTGGDGYYGMFLLAGTYNVTVTEPGFLTHTISVAVSDGSSSSINFYLNESQIPVPELQPQMISIALAIALAATLLTKRALKRTK
ncbi:MAG TPA: carboxypeptidase-like regulatory domain-containing protein [Candidatus Bathyarchaeia archaeon]|nr:carboxypeptidase-like regulatory domain-containing protein [Candidatus Bathyarchaeia archaeon]